MTGPDFRIQMGGRVIWLEATAPEPGTGADQVPNRFVDPMGFIKTQRELDPDHHCEASSVPVDLFVLRWANAIKAKWRVWTTYLTSGVVNETDAYVIAINACNLGFSGLHATEPYEVALRTVFPFGAVSVTWNVEDGQIVDISREHKPFVLKRNSADVPTTLILDETYSCISAIIATNTSPLSIPVGRPYFEFAVIHNPLAKVKLDVAAMGANVEVVPHWEGDGYRLEVVRSQAMPENGH